MQDFSKTNTICTYSKNDFILEMVAEFAANNSFSVYKAEDETDLIAVPYFLLILDINNLTGYEFFNWLNELKKENIKSYESYISHTQPKKIIDIDILNNFIIKENISLNDFNHWRNIILE